MEQIDNLDTKKKFKKTEIGEIPVDWEVTKLSNISQINMGQSPSSEYCFDYENGLPFFQGKAEFGVKYPNIRKWCNTPAKTAEKGDILISVRAPVGDINIAPAKCCIGRGLASIRGTKSNNDFLYFTLNHFKDSLIKIGQGSTFEAINRNVLLDLQIPLPPLPEQEKIAEILTVVDETIEKSDKIIKKTKELKKGIMQKLLTRDIKSKKCKIVKLKSIVNLINGRAFKPLEWGKRGLPIIRIQNLNDLCKPFNYCNFEVPEKYIINKNDILIAWSGTPGTSFGIHKWKGEKAVVNQHIFKVVFKSSDICEDYFAIIIQYKLGYLIQKAHGGVGLKHVTKNVIDEMEILLPPLSEQKRIADILSSVDEGIEKKVENKEKLENIRKGLMQVLLTGKIRVKNYG